MKACSAKGNVLFRKRERNGLFCPTPCSAKGNILVYHGLGVGDEALSRQRNVRRVYRNPTKPMGSPGSRITRNGPVISTRRFGLSGLLGFLVKDGFASTARDQDIVRYSFAVNEYLKTKHGHIGRIGDCKTRRLEDMK